MTHARSRRALAGDGLRFLVAGGLNTALTLLAYELLLFVTTPWAAYALSWVGGLLFVVAFYPSRVFPGGRTDPGARVRLGATYAALFLLGSGVLRLLGEAGVPARLAILGVLAATTVANFALGRLILRAAPTPNGRTVGARSGRRRSRSRLAQLQPPCAWGRSLSALRKRRVKRFRSRR